jgi:hypothetical protein
MVFCLIKDGPILEKYPAFSAQLLGQQHKLRAYRIALR